MIVTRQKSSYEFLRIQRVERVRMSRNEYDDFLVEYRSLQMIMVFFILIFFSVKKRSQVLELIPQSDSGVTFSYIYLQLELNKQSKIK